MNIDILDIGSGNVSSINSWLGNVNVKVNSVSERINENADILILPGVGSADSYMNRLIDMKMDQMIFEHLDKGKRLIGICLGMQIMAKYSEEGGHVNGLGLIDGYVEKINSLSPHNAWERLYLDKRKMKGQSFYEKQCFNRKKKLEGRVFFNHEYGFVCNDENSYDIKISECLSKYSALIIKDKIIGMQFHPEKSQITGRELLSMII